MFSYPSSLPPPSSWREAQPDRRSAATRSGAPQALHARGRDRLVRANASWVYGAAEMGAWRAWYDGELLRGQRWFYLPLAPGYGGPSTRAARYLSVAQRERVGPGIWRVSAELELRGLSAPPEEEIVWDGAASSSLWVLSNGNRTAQITTSNSTPYPARNLFGNRAAVGGKRYFELLIADASSSAVDTAYYGLRTDAGRFAAAANTGKVMNKASIPVVDDPVQINPYNVAPYTECGSPCRPGFFSMPNTFMFAVDLSTGAMWFGREGSWFGANPATGSLPIFGNITGTLTPYAASFAGIPNTTMTLRSLASQFQFPIPAGFSAIGAL